MKSENACSSESVEFKISDLEVSELGERLPRNLRILRIGLISSVLAYACWLRFTLPPEPFLDADSGGYFQPALSLYNSMPFRMEMGRSFLYPSLLGAILRLFGNEHSITYFQHLLGLVSGAIFFLLSAALIDSAVRRVMLRALLSILAAACTFLVLCWPSTIAYEQIIRPESSYVWLILFIMLLTFRFILKLGSAHAERILPLGTFLIFLNVLSYAYRPNVGFAIGLTPVFIAICLFQMGYSWHKTVLPICLGVFAGYLFGLMPNGYFGRDDVRRETFLPSALIACHGNLMLDLVREDLADHSRSELSIEQLTLLNRALADETARYSSVPPTEGIYRVLGINPDNIMYHNPDFQAFKASFKTPHDFASACYQLFFRFLRERPRAYFAKLSKQFWFMFGENGYLFPLFGQVNVVELESDSIRIAELLIAKNESGSKAHRLLESIIDQAKGSIDLHRADQMQAFPVNRISIPPEVRTTLTWFYKFSAVVSLALLLLFTFVRCYTRRCFPFDVGVRRVAIFSLFLLSYNFLHSFSVAAIGSVEVTRYIDVQFSMHLLFCFSAVIVMVAAIERILLPRIP